MQVVHESSSASRLPQVPHQYPLKSEISTAEQIAFGAVPNFQTACAAYALVYSEYFKCGYQEPNSCRMRFTPLQLLPVSKTFVATIGTRIVGTGTVVLASSAGLPSSHVFGDIYAELAQSGRRVCEGTLLACTNVQGTPGHVTALNLLSWGVSWALASGADDWCVVVNPKHLRFYHQGLGMEIIGDSRSCGHVADNPGLLLRMPLRELRSGAVTPTPLLASAVLDSLPAVGTDLYHFSEDEAALLLSEMPELLKNLTPGQLEQLRIQYPALFNETFDGDIEAKAAA